MNEFSPRNLTKPGLLITAAYLTAVAVYAVFERSAIFGMGPNEFGDFLAGIFSPLAFLWLVLGFYQQGDELRNSVAALNLQGEELRNSVEQQRQLVEVTRQQLGLELEAKMAAEAAEVSKASPIFHISGGFSSWSSPVCTSSFTVRNVGADCRNVHCCDSNGFSRKVALFGRQTQIQIEYYTKRDVIAEPHKVTIECYDKRGQRRKFEVNLVPKQGRYGTEYEVESSDGSFTEITED